MSTTQTPGGSDALSVDIDLAWSVLTVLERSAERFCVRRLTGVRGHLHRKGIPLSPMRCALVFRALADAGFLTVHEVPADLQPSCTLHDLSAIERAAARRRLTERLRPPAPTAPA